VRYIVNSAGYLQEVSFGADIMCNGHGCTEYTGGVPSGYGSLADWFTLECEKLHRWMIVEGELTLDPDAPEPEVYVEPKPEPYAAIKLWKNPTPTTSFAAQTLDIPGLSECDYVWINFNALPTLNSFASDLYIFKAERDGLANFATQVRYDSGVYVSQRTATVNFEAETVEFGEGYQNNVGNSGRMIPQFVVGFKGVIDETAAPDTDKRAICGTFVCGEVVAGQ
jgi:hypothetical protein